MVVGYWPFMRVYGLDSVSVHEHAKKVVGQYPALMTSRLVKNRYVHVCVVVIQTSNKQ